MVPQHAGARRRAARSLVARRLRASSTPDAGPGGNGAWLATHGDVVGVDLSADALAFVRARRPTTRPVRASVEALPFADGAYDVVVGLTILYTVPDDARAVAELARVLRPGGALLLVEPAFAALGRAHDATVHGRRRYRRPGLVGARRRRRPHRRPRHLRVLVPRAARRRARGTRPGAPPARRPRGLRRRQARARPRVRAAGRRASAAGWPRHDLPFGTSRGPARYPLTGTGARPWRSTTSRTQSPARPDSVRRMAPSRKNSDFP